MKKNIGSIILMLALVSCEESEQPSSFLQPRNYNHHAFGTTRFLNALARPEPTKQGPVVFPNDAPPAPRPPLIVTSRPLLEQIARSELNPSPPEQNNSLPEQSQVNRVTIPNPNFLAGINQYPPVKYHQPPTSAPGFLINPVTGHPLYPGDHQDYRQSSGRQLEFRHPYADVVRKNRVFGAGLVSDHHYSDYEERAVLPPIYKALADHAKQNVLKIQMKKLEADRYNNYQAKANHNYLNNDYSNDIDNDVNDRNTNGEYTKGKKYAFSYSVKDHKSGDDFSHSQHSSGVATNGEYRVRLPDGRMQIVSYVADENGYKANVRYDDEEDKNAGNTIQDYNRQNVDYAPKKQPIKDDYYNQYSDLSKEYYNNDDYIDYASKNYKDYHNYNQRKFGAFDKNINKPKVGVIVVPNEFKVKPSYEALKPLFVLRKPHQTQSSQNLIYHKIPVELSVPSTTPNPFTTAQPTTERIVVIGGSRSPLYTSVSGSIPTVPVTPTPYSFSGKFSPTYVPSSTFSPIYPKNVEFSNNKAILSSSFIDRINKYLSFN